MEALGGVNGTLCNPEQYSLSQQSYNSRTPSISCLTHGETIGLVLMAEAAIFSSLCIAVILLLIWWNIRWYRKRFPNGNWKLFQTPADIYMFSLFSFDILQATGGALNIRWAHNGIVTTGHYCTAQGIVEQIGELGVPLITLLLAIHTFIGAVLHVGLKARGVAFGLVGFVCIFVLLWVCIGVTIHKNYETPTPYWCWIGPRFPGERLGGETIWMWLTLIASAILYIPLYFWAEGFWSIDEGYRFCWWNADHRSEYSQRRAALGMLLYPVAYSLVILPLTIARCLEFGHHDVPLAATFFGVTMFYLSGAINVTLFLVARPELLLFPRPDELEVEEVELTPEPKITQAGPAVLSDTKNFQLSPEPTSATLADEGSRNSAALSHVRSATSVTSATLGDEGSRISAALSHVKFRRLSEDDDV